MSAFNAQGLRVITVHSCTGWRSGGAQEKAKRG